LFISSEHLNKKRLAPDAARKRWLEHEQTEVAGYRRCRREKQSIVQGKEPWARQLGRQTEPRPHGSQEMSVSNRNCVSSFDFCPFTLAFGQRGVRPGFCINVVFAPCRAVAYLAKASSAQVYYHATRHETPGKHACSD
jgi:hypothetical protein